MPLTKYASLEGAEILGVKGSQRERISSLDKFSDFDDYRTEDGFLYARIRAISSRVNKNHDGWPSIELAGSQEVFDRHTSAEGGFIVEADKEAEYGYSTFLGKPVFVDHHNSDPERARGVIVDAKLHVEDSRTASSLDRYYSSAPDNHLPPTWVELLLEVDAKSFPKLAQAILDGSKNPHKGIDGFSMGCNVEKSVCNICKNAATSPDEYCEHVRLKGAHFDYVDPKSGKKTSKKSYEDCYGVQFFEISAVFDPADETALLRELIHKEGSTAGYDQWLEKPYTQAVEECPKCGAAVEKDYDGGVDCPECGYGSHPPDPYDAMIERKMQGDVHDHYGKTKFSRTRTAEEAPLPQADHIKAPEDVDTLRQESVCPVCGSTMDEEQCEICGYTKPPEGFDNPDLAKHQQDQQLQQQDLGGEINEQTPEGGNQGESFGPPSDLAEPTNSSPTANVKRDDWKIAGKINVSEKPILTDTSPATDEPEEEILQDESQPTTARTAKDFIRAVGRKETPMSTKQAAEPLPAAKPDTRTDVEGVGGVEDASNEQASKADAQVAVDEKGGTPVQEVSADQENVNVDQGDEYSQNIESIPTKTWSGTDGQTEPVQGDVFPSENGQGAGKSSGWTIRAYDAEPYPSEDGGLGGGSATQGTQPADPVGKAEDRVDVLSPTTTPNNNSGPTDTWSGTDGNGVTRQQDPVTRDTLEGEDRVNLSPTRSSKDIFTAMKLADLEVDMGLTQGEKKYERIAELEAQDPAIVEASLKYAQRVKTAGLKREGSQVRQARRLPSFAEPTEPVTKEASSSDSDEALYW